jgi:hypothetical protein
MQTGSAALSHVEQLLMELRHGQAAIKHRLEQGAAEFGWATEPDVGLSPIRNETL